MKIWCIFYFVSHFWLSFKFWKKSISTNCNLLLHVQNFVNFCTFPVVFSSETYFSDSNGYYKGEGSNIFNYQILFPNNGQLHCSLPAFVHPLASTQAISRMGTLKICSELFQSTNLPTFLHARPVIPANSNVVKWLSSIVEEHSNALSQSGSVKVIKFVLVCAHFSLLKKCSVLLFLSDQIILKKFVQNDLKLAAFWKRLFSTNYK